MPAPSACAEGLEWPLHFSSSASCLAFRCCCMLANRSFSSCSVHNGLCHPCAGTACFQDLLDYHNRLGLSLSALKQDILQEVSGEHLILAFASAGCHVLSIRMHLPGAYTSRQKQGLVSAGCPDMQCQYEAGSGRTRPTITITTCLPSRLHDQENNIHAEIYSCPTCSSILIGTRITWFHSKLRLPS